MFRRHDDERVVLNNGKATDRIFIRYIKGSYADTITWTHQVRNRFITSLDYDETTIKSGTIPLSQFNVGPRGWNKLTVQINNNQAWIYFNDVYLTELAIEPVDSSKTYKHWWESGLMGDDPINSITYMRYPTVACIE